MAIQLALRSLLHNRRRLLAATTGIAFAVLLMLIELGFMTAINDSTTLWIDAMRADLMVVSHLKNDINPSKPFPRNRLERLRAVPGVEAVFPIYFSRIGNWRTAGQEKLDLIRVLAFDPQHRAWALPDLDTQRTDLQRPDVTLVDRRLRDSYGGLRRGVQGELNGRHLDVVGDFAVGPDLQLNATLVMSDVNFARYFPRGDGDDPLEWVEFGLIQVDETASIDAVQASLLQTRGDDLDILTPTQLKQRIHGFWLRHQPVGAVFGIGLVVGFCIGLMICYQILFTDVIDQLPQLATLKAMGYGADYLRRLILARSLFLAGFALVLGLPAGYVAFDSLQNLTGLTFTLTAERTLLVASFTVLMCALAGWLAMRRALAADPAELF